MRSSWRRSTVLVLALTVAMLLGAAGMASAEISSLAITAPTHTAPVYAKPGDTIHATVEVGASAGDYIWIRGSVGTGSTSSYFKYGPAVEGTNTYSVNALVSAGESEGWTNVSVDAYIDGGPTWSQTNEDSVCVDKTPPPVPNGFSGPATPGNDNTPTWSWNDSVDTLSGTDHYEVQIALSEDNGTWGSWGAADPATVPAADWTSAGLAGPGFYKIQVRAVDKAGNASAYAASGVYQFDNAVPTDPATVTVAPPSPAQNKQPAWSWTASDDDDPDKPWQSEVKEYDFSLTRNAEAPAVHKVTAPSVAWQPGADMEDGKYTVTVLARDNAGNVSAAVPGEQYILDTTRPPNVGTITGPTSPGKNSSPTFSWDAVDDGTWGSGIKHYEVQIKKGSDPIAAADPATVMGTSWTPTSPLSDETYKIQVRAVDNVNLASAGWTESTEYWLDTVPPDPATAIVVPPSPGTNKKPEWTWTAATDNVGGSGVKGYNITVSADDGLTYGTVAPAFAAGESWTPTNDLADGKYKIKVVAVDNAGNTSAPEAAATSYHLDTTPPSVPGTFVNPTPNPGTADNPTWTWTGCTDASGGVGLHSSDPYEVEISADGGATWAAAVPDTVNAASWTPSPVLSADGDYTIRVRSVDDLNNKSDWGVGGTYVFDTTVPTNPSAIIVTPASPSNNKRPTWSWTAGTDAGSGVAKHEVRYKEALGAWSGPVDVNAPDVTWTPGFDLTDGTWEIGVTAVDGAGNKSAETTGGTYLLDTTGPGVPHTFVDPTPTPGNDTTPTWTWSAPADAGVGLHETAPYEVQISLNNAPYVNASPATVASTSWTADPELAADGKYKIQVLAVDKLGNKSAYAQSGEYWLDTTKPVIDEDTWSANDNEWFNTGDLTFTVDAYDPNASSLPPTGSGLKKSPGSIEVAVSGSTSSFSANWSGDTIQVSIVGAADGAHIIQLRVSDQAGNLSEYESRKFNVDTQAPSSSGMSYAPFTNDSTPGITWTKSTDPGYPDTGSGVVGYEVQIGTTDGGHEKKPWTSVGNVLALDDAGWTTLGVELAPDGDYYVQVRAVDAVGWTSLPSAAKIVVDKVSPVLENGLPTGYGNATPTISADFTDERSGLAPLLTILMLTHKHIPAQMPVGNITGDPTYLDGDLSTKIKYTPTYPLAEDGEYTVDMTAYDRARNKSNTLEWTFNVDTTPPTDPGEPYAGNMHDNGTWYINTLRPTFKWAASEDPNAPDGTPGSGLKEYWFQFGTKASKPMSNTEDTWAAAMVDKKSGDPVVPTAGADTQQWTPAADLPLAVGVEYAARVKALDNVNNASVWVDPPLIYDPDKPTAPGTPGTTSPTVDRTPTWSWDGSTDAISGVDGYHIQIRHFGSADWDVLDTFLDIPDNLTPANPQTWTQGLSLADGQYQIRVRAMDVAGNHSDWSGVGEVIVDATPPAAPEIKALNPGYNTSTIAINWDDVINGTNTITYALQYADNAVFDTPALVTGLTASTYDFPAAVEGEGEYWFRVKTVSRLPGSGGIKESDWSLIASTIYDATGPDAPELMLLTPNPTNQSPQTWSWSAPAGATRYEVQADNGAWVNVNDTRTYQTAFNATGPHTFKVKAYDWLGNEGPAATGNVYVDREAPAVPTGLQLTEPDGTIIETVLYTADETPKVEWNAVTDSDLFKYVVEIDGQDWITVLGPTTSYEFTEGLADGEHTVKVKAVDALGNDSVYSAALVFTVHTTPPPVPGIPTTTSPTKNQKPSWTWTLSPGAIGYNVYLDGEAMPSEFVVAPTPPDAMLFVHTTTLAEGVHHLQVTAVDDLGNESAKSGTGHVTIDLTGPTAPSAPIAEVNPTNQPTQLWWWDYVEDAVKFEVQASEDGSTWSPSTDVGNATSCVTGFAGDGVTRYLRVRAFDALGNVGYPSNPEGWSARGSVLVDTVKPAAPTNLAVDETPTANQQPTWAWTASASVDVASYEVSLDGAAAVNIGKPTPLAYKPAPLANGTHALKVRAIDLRGNASGWTAEVEVEVDTTVAKPNAPVATKNPTNEIPVWTWDAVTDLHGPVTYRVYLDGSLKESGWATTTWAPAAIPVPDGPHYLEIEAVDDLDNVSAKSERGYVVIDTTPPAVPAMKALAPFTKDATLTFEWSASDTAVKYELSYSKNGGTSWTEVPNLTDQSYTVNIADVADGIAVLGKVRAYDGVGNVSEYSGAVQTIIDRTGPVVTITKPTAAVTTNAAEFKYEWTAVDGGCGVDYCTVLFNGGEHRVTATTGGGAYAWTGALIEGANTFEVWATDKLGNKSKVVAAAPIVTQVKPQIILGQPMQGTYKINEISTIAFQVIGLHDAVPEVRLNGELLDAWRIVTVVNSTTMAKFYVLLDGDVLVPGRLDVGIAVGKAEALYSYTVDSERSGFGFGRLRPW